MLGQPVYFLTPDVIGVNVTGALEAGRDGDRHGPARHRTAAPAPRWSASSSSFSAPAFANLTLPDRATISNMSPEYGATIGFFPVDEQTCRYLRQTARPETAGRGASRPTSAPSNASARRCRRNRLHGRHRSRSRFGRAEPCRPEAAAGPRPAVATRARFDDGLWRSRSPAAATMRAKRRGDGGAAPRAWRRRDRGDHVLHQHIESRRHGDGRPGREEGGRARSDESSPGSRRRSRPARAWSANISRWRACSVISNRLGFMSRAIVAPPASARPGRSMQTLEKTITDDDVVACAVLSGNRNFEARIHPVGARGVSRQSAAGRCLCARRHGRYRSRRTSRSARPRTATKSI